VKNFEEVKNFWLDSTKGIKPNKKQEPVVFIVVYPKKMEWDFASEKQLQTTLLQTSGGITGAGTGHNQKICYLTELNDVLETCDKYTHAMIVSVGMVFDMVNYPTSIQRFYNWTRTDEFCKGHIIARPNKPAFLHHQHIELNLTKWRELDKPNIRGKWNNFVRADDNFHDDYTPSWIDVDGLPTITNFSNEERKRKAWSYGHMPERREMQTKNWSIINSKIPDWQNDIDISDNYFKILLTRMRGEVFYAENTEAVGKLPKKKFDLILTPTAGYSGEYFAEHLDFDGDIIFYDYCSENVEIKQNIVEMNMSMDEIKLYARNLKHMIAFNQLVGSVNRQNKLKERTNTYGTYEELRELQLKMYDNYNIEYKVWDIINWQSKDMSWFVNKIKGKRVFMDISNIYGYHVSHACYSLPQLKESFKKMVDILKSNTEYYHLRGTDLSKRGIKNGG
tara:strand:- start:689 stop:2035 length:1347 start_codon:yes stop_codon:yes gene_type:complete